MLNILEKIKEDGHFLNRICFSDEATFHVSGKLNKHNARIWETENPHITKEIECDSPKVNDAAVETIDEEILKRTWTEIEYHLDVLHATNGAHIKIY